MSLQTKISDLKFDMRFLASGAELNIIHHFLEAEKLLDKKEFLESANELEKAYQGDDSWSDRLMDMVWDIRGIINRSES